MRYTLRVFTCLMLSGVASPLAAQTASDASRPPDVAVEYDSQIGVTTVAVAADVTQPTDAVVLEPSAQTGVEPPVPTPPHTGIRALSRALARDVVHIPTKGNLMVVAIGGVAAAAMHPVDDTANARFSGPTLNKLFRPGATLGQSYVLLPAAASVYAFGRMAKHPRVSHIGSDLIESLAVAELMTQTTKYAVRRERPDGSGANSFPSGHAAGTMAFATTLERHFGWRYYLPAYAVASYVAVSRLHDNRHYVSDVVFGSAVGIIAGRTVTRHGREQFPIQAMAIPGGGVAVMYVK